MAKKPTKKTVTDNDVKKKAVKLVIAHLKKKVDRNFIGSDHVERWLNDMDELLAKSEFNLIEYIEMRKRMNDVIERIVDEEVRFKMRDSWYSFGKALDKKVKQK